MEFNNFIYEEKDGIAYITFNNPKQLNALSSAVLTEFEQIVSHLEKNTEEIGAVISTGQGKAYVAGADISEMVNMDVQGSIKYLGLANSAFNRFNRLPQVTIAAINGFALGGGFEIALAHDIRIASENAVVGFPETGLGIIPGFAGTQRLPRLVGTSKAKEMIFTANNYKAEQALALGLVSEVTDAEGLIPAAEKLAGKIIKKPRLAIAKAKLAIDMGVEMSLEDGIRYENEIETLLFTTDDKVELMSKFLNK